MKIFIDIGHPAHVHYYKNFIKKMEKEGHEFLVMARDRDFIHTLLEHENIEFVSRGKGSKTTAGKFLYAFWAIFFMLFHAIKFKPDVFLAHSVVYVPFPAFLLGADCVCTGDTDYGTANKKYFLPLITAILSPSCFSYNLGEKHIFFDSYMELMYLHPNYFSPKKELVDEYLIDNNKLNVLIRFVSWEAFHDRNVTGLSKDLKKSLIRKIEPYCNIYISSEKPLEPFFEKYKIDGMPPYLIHHLMGQMDLFVGESATMASESAVLGVPAIYLNQNFTSNTAEQQKEYGLVFNYSEPEEIIEKACDLVKTESLKGSFEENHRKLLREKEDPTKFLISFFNDLE